MPTIEAHATAEIEAPVAACAAVLVDVERYPEWHPLVEHIRVLARDGAGRPELVEAGTDVPGRRIRYVVRCLADPPGRVWTEYVEGDLDRLETDWRLEDLGAARTRVRIDVAGRVGGLLGAVVRGPLREAIRRELTADAVAALKRRVEKC